MARHIWQSDFARLWFGLRSGTRVRVGKVRNGPDPYTARSDPGAARPLGIVERNRLARRHKWALKRPE